MQFKILLIFLLTTQLLFAQNLIPNPSFEEINTCFKYHEQCAPKGWRSTNLKNFYYPEYLSGVRKAIRPKEGMRSVAFTLFFAGKEFERKFAQAALICELKKGAQYRLRLHYLIKKAAIEEFGVYFADSLNIELDNERFKKIEPQISVPFNPDLNAGEWTVFETIYTARGGEKGIVIGNFNLDSDTHLIPSRDASNKEYKTEKAKRIYYRFDEISLTPLTLETVSDCNYDLNLETIYKDSIRHLIINPVTIDQIDEIEEKAEPQVVEPPKFQKIIFPEKALIVGMDTVRTNEIFTLENINFETNSARLLPSSFSVLERLVNILNIDRYLKLHIIGHTDDVGGGNFNQMLSELRAKSVAEFLVQNGINQTRIQTFGMGESQPLKENDSEDGRLRNRRVEFVFKYNF